MIGRRAAGLGHFAWVLLAGALPLTVSAASIKIRSDPQHALLDGVELSRLGPGDTLKGAAIGPGQLQLIVRRLAGARAKPIVVRVTRNGREVANLFVSGKPKDKVEGQKELAGPPQRKAIDLPPGPHTVVVEVGPGEGYVLVAFEEDEAPRPVAETPVEAPKPVPSLAAAKLTELIAAPEVTRKTRLFIGARAGLAGQTQLLATGPAVGGTIRYALTDDTSDAGTSGLLAGLSVDYLRYQLGFKVGASRSLPGFQETLAFTAVPLLLESSWAFGRGDGSRRLTPFLGICTGVVITSLTSGGPLGGRSETRFPLAIGAQLGAELPIGSNRLGLEARLIAARTGADSVASNLQIGGLLAQATWRFGL